MKTINIISIISAWHFPQVSLGLFHFAFLYLPFHVWVPGTRSFPVHAESTHHPLTEQPLTRSGKMLRTAEQDEQHTVHSANVICLNPMVTVNEIIKAFNIKYCVIIIGHALSQILDRHAMEMQLGLKWQRKKAGYPQQPGLECETQITVLGAGLERGTSGSRAQHSDHSTTRCLFNEVLILRCNTTSRVLFLRQWVLADSTQEKKTRI